MNSPPFRDQTDAGSGCDLSFTATDIEARYIIQTIEQWLKGPVQDPEPRTDIVIAVSEALNNIVEHAYAGQSPGPVKVCLYVVGTSAFVEFQDNGHPLPDGEPPVVDGIDLSGPIETLPEGGFGWFLIRKLVRSLRYERLEGRNRLVLEFAIVPDQAG